MNCLTIEDIQRIIDRELDEKKANELNEHLSRCTICKQAYNQQLEFSTLIKNQINKNAKSAEFVPPFAFHKIRKQIKKQKSIWLKIASVFVPLFIAGGICFNYFTPESKHFEPTNEDIMMYESYNSGIDVNTAVQQKMIITTIYDQNNGKIQTTIN